jgi:hypothetical protein
MTNPWGPAQLPPFNLRIDPINRGTQSNATLLNHPHALHYNGQSVLIGTPIPFWGDPSPCLVWLTRTVLPSCVTLVDMTLLALLPSLITVAKRGPQSDAEFHPRLRLPIPLHQCCR